MCGVEGVGRSRVACIFLIQAISCMSHFTYESVHLMERQNVLNLTALKNKMYLLNESSIKLNQIAIRHLILWSLQISSWGNMGEEGRTFYVG